MSPRDAKSGLPAAPRQSPNNLAAAEPSKDGGRVPARLQIEYVPGDEVSVRIVAGDELGEIEIREALAEREIGLAVAAAIWRFVA